MVSQFIPTKPTAILMLTMKATFFLSMDSHN